MRWTFEDYKHYSTEHMQKVEKQSLAKGLEKHLIPLRKGKRGKQRDVAHSL